MARRDKEFLLRCAYEDCRKETRIMLAVPAPSVRRSGKQEKKIQLTRNCEHCNRPNIINVPQTWNSSELILGGSVVDSRNGIAILQGEQLK